MFFVPLAPLTVRTCGLPVEYVSVLIVALDIRMGNESGASALRRFLQTPSAFVDHGFTAAIHALPRGTVAALQTEKTRDAIVKRFVLDRMADALEDWVSFLTRGPELLPCPSSTYATLKESAFASGCAFFADLLATAPHGAADAVPTEDIDRLKGYRKLLRLLTNRINHINKSSSCNAFEPIAQGITFLTSSMSAEEREELQEREEREKPEVALERILDQLLEREALRRCKDRKARVIQAAWRHAIIDPAYTPCRHRLLREYKELSHQDSGITGLITV